MSEYLAIVIWFNLSSSLYSSTVTVEGWEEGGGKGEGERGRGAGEEGVGRGRGAGEVVVQ